MKKNYLFFTALIFLSACGESEKPENYGHVVSQLYVGANANQPLIVGLGGSEGGNAWASDYWKSTRDRFIAAGYAFLAVGYFGTTGTPDQLDRISIDAVFNEITNAARHTQIDSNRIFLIGGSKGAELALLLASHYSEIKGVVGIVPCHAAFPSLTITASTSSWMLNDQEVPFVPMPWVAVPSAMKKDLRGAFSIMIENKEAVDLARIAVENINGPILLVSATKDEMWPSTEMSDDIIETLKRDNFSYPYSHVSIQGGHTEPLKHFDTIFYFLNKHFNADPATK